VSDALRRQSVLLGGVAEAARLLLAIVDIDKAVLEALAAIGRAAMVDCICVWKNRDKRAADEPASQRLYEWTTAYTVGNRAASQPLRINIAIDDCLWGALTLEAATDERIWQDAELVALQTVATCIGCAIERDRRQKSECETPIAQAQTDRAAALEQANQVLTVRERWLETTAIAASKLLSAASSEVSVNEALQIIGENLQCDRLGIMRHVPAAGSLGTFRLLYEWDSAGTISQMTKESLVLMPASDFTEWTIRLMAGRSAGGLVSEQKEPFRSKMQALNTLCAYAVPIFIASEFWGFMFMDYCRELRQLTSAELAVFETTATCVGGAIHQEQIQRDRQQAERAILIEQEREQAAQARAAQLQESNTILSSRERWLDATAAAAGYLLSSESLESAITPTLKILGERVDVDRVGLMKVLTRDGARVYGMYAEWSSTQQPSQSEHEEMQEIPAEILGELMNERLAAGCWVGGDIEDEIFSAALREGLKQLGIQTSYAVPIFVEDTFWGVLGVDHCRKRQLLTEPEISVFQTIASCFGSTIYRDRIRQAREVARRTAIIERERAARAAELEAANEILMMRDRWLETTAIVANELLSTTAIEKSIAAALRMIGENLDCDRVFIFQKITVENAPAYGTDYGNILFKMIYEWYSEGLTSNIDDPCLAEVPGSRFVDITQKMLNGEWLGDVVDELPEPVRSYQQALGVKSLCAVPVFIKGEMWGVIGINYCREPRRMNPAEIAAFRTTAACIGSAIDQEEQRREQAAQARYQAKEEARRQSQQAVLAEREKAAQERAAKLAENNEVINRTLATLATSPKLDNFLCLLVQELAMLVSAANTGLFLYDAEENTLSRHIVVQDGKAHVDSAQRDAARLQDPFPADVTKGWSSIFECTQPIAFVDLAASDANDLSLWWQEVADWQANEGYCQLVGAKMKVGDVPIGFIGFCFKAPVELSPEQIGLVQALTNQATLSIQLTRLASDSQQAALGAALSDERARLAREIHDTLAQSFTGVSLQLEAVRSITSKLNESLDFNNPNLSSVSIENAQTYIRRARDLARQGLSEARRSVRALRSEALETDTLPAALQKVLNQTQRDTGLTTHFYIEGEPFALLADDIQLNLLRIAQEAITNTLRYAQATQLDLTLTFTTRTSTTNRNDVEQIQLSIVDNGIGFDPAKLHETSGFGLIGIRERTARFNGEFELLSTPGIGTTVKVMLPLDGTVNN